MIKLYTHMALLFWTLAILSSFGKTNTVAILCSIVAVLATVYAIFSWVAYRVFKKIIG